MSLQWEMGDGGKRNREETEKGRRLGEEERLLGSLDPDLQNESKIQSVVSQCNFETKPEERQTSDSRQRLASGTTPASSLPHSLHQANRSFPRSERFPSSAHPTSTLHHQTTPLPPRRWSLTNSSSSSSFLPLSPLPYPRLPQSRSIEPHRSFRRLAPSPRVTRPLRSCRARHRSTVPSPLAAVRCTSRRLDIFLASRVLR